MRVLTKEDVRQLLPMEKCIEILEETMPRISMGESLMPPRIGTKIPVSERAMLGYMPGYLKSPECFGAKVITIFPGNKKNGHSSHSGVVVLFDTEHGQPIAIIDAGEITAIRTAAASALATRALSRQDSAQLTILGNGEQAYQHLIAIPRVRDISHVRVWGRSIENARYFVSKHSDAFSGEMSAVESIESAVEGSDIICTTTSSSSPILEGKLIEKGMHLNVVGASLATQAEVDTQAVKKSKFFVDYEPSARDQAGEFLNALTSGDVASDHICGEIGGVLLGQVHGRTSPSEVTLYKSLGAAAQDLASSHYVFEQANEKGVGVLVRG